MSSVRVQGAALGAIVERDFRIFVSYRFRAFAQLFSLVLTMTIFHFVSQLVAVERFATPEEYFAFVVSGLLIMFVLQSAAAAVPGVRQELVAGTFERSLVSPTGAIIGTIGMLIFPVTFAIVIAVFGFSLAALVFDLPVVWSTAPLALPVIMLSAVAFGAIGVLILAVVIAFKQSFGAAWIVVVISLTGGLYFPVELLPGWLAWISDLQPFTPAVEAVRDLLVSSEADADPLLSVLKLIGFTLVLAPLSFVALRAAVAFGRRRGTILEY